MGLRGAEVIRVGESCKELVVAPECGYFFEDAAVKTVEDEDDEG